MAEIKQGLNYEITANDKSSAVVNKAAQKVKKAAKEAGDQSKKAGIDGAEGFNAMSAATNVLSGNIAGAGMEVGKLLPKFRGLGASGAVAIGALGAAIYGVTKSLGSLMDFFKEKFNLGAAPKEIRDLKNTMHKLESHSIHFADEMARARKESERNASIFESEMTSINKLTKAQLEYRRAMELSRATSEKQREEVNKKYDDKTIQVDDEATVALGQRRSQDLLDEERRLRKELADAKRRKKGYDKIRKDLQASAGEVETGLWDDLWGGVKSKFTGRNYGNDYKMDLLNAATEADLKSEAEADNIEGIIKKLDDIKIKIRESNRDNEATLQMIKNRKLMAANKQKLLEEEAAAEALDAAKKKEASDKAAAEKKAAEEKRATERNAAIARKAAEEEAKAIEAAQLKANRRVMEERKRQLATLTEQESQAAARVAAAQSKVAEAWGWYRDKSKMAAQLKEEKAEAEAQKQFEKDFEDLKWRRDWRTAKDLSVDQEAVRRVVLAKEEETAAQKALAETAKSTAQAAASLAEIEKVITQEG